MRVEQVLERLEGVHGSDGQWHARCPAHEDRQASMTVALGRDGRVLLTCWAGCALEAIVHAIGLDVRDLFVSRSERAIWNAPERVSLAAAALPSPRELSKYSERLLKADDVLRMLYEVKGWRAGIVEALELGLVGDRIVIPLRDGERRLVNLLRYQPNGGRGPKMLAEQGYPRVPLYALVDDDGPVWIVEGEADAISVASVGLNVIGAPGASAKARAEWLDVARGRDVVVCMDHDDAGRRAAQRWARAAVGRGAHSVRVVEWAEGTPEKYDVGDVVRELRDDPDAARRRLLELALGAGEWEDGPARVQAGAPTAAPSAEDVDALEPGELVLRPLSSVRARRVHWLWRGRIPRGRVGIVFGPPGLGKSTLMALLMADVTAQGGRVLIASAEDDAETTIRPRTLAAGADAELVTLLSTRASRGETNLVLPRDIDALGHSLAGRSLLIVDPLAAHLGDDVNTWNEQQVRALVLAPLAWHAREHDCTVVCIMHLNKSQGMDALARISGSGGFGGAARFALLLGSHPDDVGRPEPRQVLVHVKASEGKRHAALVFRRSQVLVAAEDDEGDVETPVLELVGEDTRVVAESVLAATDPDEAGAFTDAVEWLRLELANGMQPAKRLLSTARERGDFSERTLRKAKRALRVKSVRELDGWYWERETA